MPLQRNRKSAASCIGSVVSDHYVIAGS